MKRFMRVFMQSFSFPAEHGSWLGHPHGVAWQPLVDIYECRDKLILVTELPGVDQKDIKLTVQNNLLRITGTRSKDIPAETQRVHQMEIPHGPFARVVELPPLCDIEHIEAEYDKGYLVVRIPRLKVR